MPASPLGGNKVIKLNDNMASGLKTRTAQTFPVTSANALFQFAYAGAWQDGTHACCEQSSFKILVYDCMGALLSCSSFTMAAPGPFCTTSSPGTFNFEPSGSIYWSSWKVRYIDLTPFIGTCVTIQVINSGCTATGHYGIAYFDAKCGGGQLTGPGIGGNPNNPPPNVNYCGGSNQAVLTAPLGYVSYQWVAPGTGMIPARMGGTAGSYTVTNPVAGSVYTVNLLTLSGCAFISTYTITPTQVSIVGIGAGAACSAGASNGSATVAASGSGTGYNYTWLNAGNSVVGTGAVLNNVLPGVYHVSVTAIGSPGCGAASQSVSVPVGPGQYNQCCRLLLQRHGLPGKPRGRHRLPVVQWQHGHCSRLRRHCPVIYCSFAGKRQHLGLRV